MPSQKNPSWTRNSEVHKARRIRTLLIQGSSASHMSGAKVRDVISRLPDCAGEASDAVSAYTQVKMEDGPIVLRLPTGERPVIWVHANSDLGNEHSQKFCLKKDGEKGTRMGLLEYASNKCFFVEKLCG